MHLVVFLYRLIVFIEQKKRQKRQLLHL